MALSNNLCEYLLTSTCGVLSGHWEYYWTIEWEKGRANRKQGEQGAIDMKLVHFNELQDFAFDATNTMILILLLYRWLTAIFRLVFLSLIAIVFISAGSILIKLSSTLSKEQEGYSYHPSSMVLFSEILKMLIATFFTKYFNNSFDFNWKELSLYIIPAFLYFIGNSLMFVAISGMDPSSYLLLSNLKIFTTATFCWLLLKRSYSNTQILALFSLFIGCVISQFPDGEYQIRANLSALIAIFIICTTSGCATAYTEYLLKDSETPFHKQNMQLYSFGILFATINVFFTREDNIYVGFDQPLTIAILVTLSIGGMVLGAIMKYIDSIIKTYLSSIAIILTAVLSTFLFNSRITNNGIIGYIIILFSLYGWTRKWFLIVHDLLGKMWYI